MAKNRGRKQNKKGWIIFGIVAVICLFSILLLVGSKYGSPAKDKIAVIPIKGVISTSNGDSSFFSQGGVSSGDIVGFIEQAGKDSQIKGIIININSPGGSAVASKEIVDAIKKTDKPVVALIREVGASGAYWVASATDYIIADPLSITGSIGVLGSYLEFSDLMSEYGVEYQKITSGKYKDLGNPYEDLSIEGREILLRKLKIIHDYFSDDVNKNRGKDLSEYSQGLFYLGTEAKEAGLIDELGNKDAAVNKVKELANIKDYELVFYARQRSFFDVLSQLGNDFGFNVGRGVGSEFLMEEQDFNIRLE